MQDLDSRADRITHQRRTLPEIAQVAELEKERSGLVDQVRDAQILVDDLTVEQKKVDADVEAVKTRRTRDRDRMDSGAISNPKDLERMSAELVSLERRIGTLEDEELEVMERLEAATAMLQQLSDQVAVIEEKRDELESTRAAKDAGLATELAEVQGARGPAAEGLPEPLVKLYDRLRAAKGGVAAAPLVQRRCTGCQLALDPGVLAEFRAATTDEVLRCEECDRIIVRTAESGL